MTDTKIVMMQKQAKEHQGLLGATGSQEETRKDSPLDPSEGAHPADTLTLDF